MNKAVYSYFYKTFGRTPGYWAGVAGEVIRALFLRIFGTLIIAHIATLLAAGNIESAKLFTLYYLILHVSGSIVGTLGELAGTHSQNSIYNGIRMVFYLKLTGKDMSFYRNNQTGYLTGSFRQHLDGLMVLGRLLRSKVVQVLISVTVPVIILFTSSWQVGLVALAIVAVQVLYIFWASAKANKYRTLSHEIYRKITGEVADEITNITAFKASGKEDLGKNKVALLGNEETAAYWMRRKTNVLLDLPRNIITGVGMSLGLFVVLSSNASTDPSFIGLMVLTMMLLFQLVRNVGEIPALMIELDDLVTQIYPTLNYLGDTNERIKDPASPKPLHIKKGTIHVENVGFSYLAQNDQMVPVFNNLSITIPGGQHVGIVGLSGAGKSTLASLLMRFDDVESGRILIDGTDIRETTQSGLRQNIAYVPQEPLLFHRSIRENIAYFNDADDKSIIKAAKAAHAHEFIKTLPDGYDTMVGERGVKLSGGQKQRIVIARAILKNAPIMIFDEATSALDSESEQIIQKAMPKIIGKHTAIIIAHRLSTVAGLDRIIVLENGKIIEDGSHEELLAKRGRYFRLWQRQAHEETTA